MSPGRYKLLFVITTAALLFYLAIISYRILVIELSVAFAAFISLMAVYIYRVSRRFRSDSMENVIVASLLATIFLFYLWTASTSYAVGKTSFRFGFDEEDPYNLLSHAMMKGSLSLLIQPDPGLLSLPDPYDPVKNGAYRLNGAHDLSLYRGKFYIYFGPVPAIVMFMPFHLLSGLDMPGNLALVLFCIGGTILTLLIFRVLVGTFFPQLSFWMRLMSISLLCICNMCLYNLRRPLMYEIAIASGFFFLAAALYLLLINYLGCRNSRAQIALASLALGLAAGSRPTMALAGIVLVLYLAHISAAGKGWTALFKRDTALNSLPVLLPFTICIAAICLYNHARFGSITEFGLSWQLTSIRFEDRVAISHSPELVLRSLGNFFFLPVAVNGAFPFFHCSKYIFLNYHERASGLMTLMPFVIFLLFMPASLAINRFGEGRKLNAVIAVFTGLGLLLLFSCCFIGFTQRFFNDFMFLLITASLMIFFTIVRNGRYTEAFRRMLLILMVLTSSYSVLANIAISLEGDSNLLSYLNPEIYNSILRFFHQI